MDNSSQNKTTTSSKSMDKTEKTDENSKTCENNESEEMNSNQPKMASIFNLKQGSSKSDDEQSNSEYNTTETSCSINSDDCIEYDSDISSDDSIFFYSDNDEFVENRFLRINHRPFMKILKDKHDQLTSQNVGGCEGAEGGECGGGECGGGECGGGNKIPCPSSMSRHINKELFDKINKLNNELEVEYNNLKQMLNIEDTSEEELSCDNSNKFEVIDTSKNKTVVSECNE